MTPRFWPLVHWEQWLQTPIVALPDAIALTYGFDPNGSIGDFPWNGRFSFVPEGAPRRIHYELFLTFQAACVALHAGDLARYENVLPRNSDKPHVNLKDFCRWIHDRNFKLPGPLLQLIGESPADTKPEKGNEIIVKLPYENAFIRACARIMWDFYDPDSSDGYKAGKNQVGAGLEFDKLIGLKNEIKNTLANRLTRSIVARLLPAAHQKLKLTQKSYKKKV